ncbi:MAG: cysteine rich repeat-containing protein [Pseudomonadota bacterium]
MSKLVAVHFALALSAAAWHAPASAASVLEACKPELATFCAEVTPGHGRISACLYAHEEKLSEACDAATVEMADTLDLFFARIREVGIACGEDIHTHCEGIAIGGGRIMSCLRENVSVVSASCTAIMETMPTPAE